MRSHVAAMLWENWRLTYVEAAQRLAQGILVTAAVLAGVAAFGSLGNGAARLALGLLAFNYAPLWVSVAKLNGGRFMDGYRPGYPFYFLYARPVRTLVLVGAPMAYNVALIAALYIVSALVLRGIFGHPLPLLPLAAWLVAFHIAQWAVQWGTSSKVVQWVGSIGASLVFGALGFWRTKDWPTRLDVPLTDYALLAALSVLALGLAVAGVARQRRGDARAALPRAVTRNAFSEWLAGLFRFPCPTTSAARAQMWFDVKSSGLPVLAIGGALAILNPLVFIAATSIDAALSGTYARPVAIVVAVSSLPIVLLLAGNTFGIRIRQGHRHASVFDATQACGTAWIAGIKVFVRSACLLIALAAVGTSVWTSASLIPFDVLDDHDTFIQKSRSPLSGWMRGVQGAVLSMSASELVALALVTCLVVAVIVALRASLPALRARYPRRVAIAGWTLLFHGLVLVLLSLAAGQGIVSTFVATTIFAASKWSAAAAMALATLYVAWRVFAEGLLTLRGACIAVLVSVAFAAAWLTMLRAAGVQIAEMRATGALLMLSPLLLQPFATVLAPWSLSRIRHT